MMKLYTGTNEKNGVEVKLPEAYTSKSIRGECKNNGCINKRRDKSAYCQECSNELITKTQELKEEANKL